MKRRSLLLLVILAALLVTGVWKMSSKLPVRSTLAVSEEDSNITREGMKSSLSGVVKQSETENQTATVTDSEEVLEPLDNTSGLHGQAGSTALRPKEKAPTIDERLSPEPRVEPPGHPPPPEDHLYVMTDGGWKLQKIGEPIYSVEWVHGYNPTPIEARRLAELDAQLTDPDLTPVQRASLQSERDELYEQAHRPTKRVRGFVVTRYGETANEDIHAELDRRLEAEE